MRENLILIGFPIAPYLVLRFIIASVLPGAEQREVATFRYLGFPLYKARLFTKNSASLTAPADPLRCGASCAAVVKGDSYLAATQGPNRIGLWRNVARSCTLIHPRIAARCIGTFLGDNIRSRSFTRRLRDE